MIVTPNTGLWPQYFKRVIDCVVAGLGLILLAPMFLVVAILVALFLGRPIFFRQKRPGRNGEPFTLIKFRSMAEGGESDTKRLTKFGTFLRSTSLDEIPELWNVLKGEMSLVGPRPLLLQYLPLYSDRQALRHSVRPGLTGLAQVSGRNALDWNSRLELDAQYVVQCSLGMDLRIAGKTVVQVLQRNGVTAEGESTVQPFRGANLHASVDRDSA